MTTLFYRCDNPGCIPGPGLPSGLVFRSWMPVEQGFPPSGSRSFSNLVWWASSRLGLFARRDLAELSIWSGKRKVHHLLVTPRWHRFPFMAPEALQLGDLWTHPDWREQGLARAAIAEAHRRFADRTPCFWYVTDAANAASIALITSCGYRLAGSGHRTRPFRIKAAGQFLLDSGTR